MSVDGKACISDLRDLNAAIRNNATHALRAALEAAEADAKSTTLYKNQTGTLRQNTKADAGQISELKGSVVADTKYAAFVENGTPPHRIEARNATVLRFVQNGAVRFARAVNHPGTAERPFMAHARGVGEQTLEYGLEYFVDEAIKRG